jgi:hypothetical protein
MSYIGYREACGRTEDRVMADFEIKRIGESWLLTPTTRASRLWCQSNLAHEDRKPGDGYVLEEQLMRQIIEQFMARTTGWIGS